MLNDFETKNPDLKVEFIHVPQNYFQKLHLLFASNLAPDVIFINNLYSPIYIKAGDYRPVEKAGDGPNCDATATLTCCRR
jgi:multiple sugar transport system substrate-binding protein